MEVVIAIAIILGLSVVVVLATAQRRANTGRLSRETRSSDAGGAASGAAGPGTQVATANDLDEAARARADESRRAIARGGGLPVPVGDRGVVRYEPVDEDELGVTRRQFFNRGILLGTGLGIGTFGAAALAFLWPPSSGAGTSGKVNVGSVDLVKKSLEDKEPFYNASAKVYIQPYPKDALAKAKKVYPSTILSGMEAGYIAIYQKCVHLGCRVPWCQTSQWFECPCHGSKYNRVGEKRGGPAPRGLDSFPLEVSGGAIFVNTSPTSLVQGQPIGTDTTGQGQEGAPCV